jgi:tellurium resistance protein TerZ
MQLIKKGESIDLVKKDGGGLEQVAVGLGWGQKTKKGFFGGTKYIDVDLDASCILYDSDKNPVDVVFFQKLVSDDGSIVHSGDDLGGGGSENDPNEIINVFLHQVPGNVTSIVFVVNSYSGESFAGVPFAFCNVTDTKANEEAARYNLTTDGIDYKGFIIAKVHRQGASWKFHAIGEPCHGRQQTLQDIEPLARRHA